jgi:hypothetical protein
MISGVWHVLYDDPLLDQTLALENGWMRVSSVLPEAEKVIC